MKYFIKNLTDAMFKKYLLTTNIVSSGILMSIGDAVSQYVERKTLVKHEEHQKFQFNWSRNGTMFVVGALQGPMHHYFYGWLDGKFSGATLKHSTIKILFDQFVMSPACIVMFFYSAGWMYKQTTDECNQELKSKFVTVYIADWMVWPFAQFINFYYLHPKYRVIYVNFVTMMYNVFLSYVKHTDVESLKYFKH
ncbi:mpv17-like protein 2 [Sitodiplosis mosellana]|uniref:mpv17-like protein 2 n=1 Tax=Sitodiplosis mosellana TaxID=263140 RepID=UPI0024441975|nr:mpv17-like protein 2 [Sitodiplosis mosellana]